MNPAVSIRDVAHTLARAHREADPDTTDIFLIEDPSGREIRLLEVSSSCGYTGAVMPVRFKERPDLGVPYPVTIVLLSPKEKEALDNGDLELPPSWGPSPKRALIQ